MVNNVKGKKRSASDLFNNKDNGEWISESKAPID